MSSVVVRCPACRGLSRVEAATLELTVACPRCGGAFVALEEAELVAPGPRQPVTPPPPRLIPEPPPVPPPEPAPPPPAQEQDHDPHRNPPGSLPASVLIGLALLPFAIPILWVIAPAVAGQEPMLSWAVPVALAVSASVLCLAVIYTIDWSPGTRVKGVLMIVALAYFAALNLYFLKKQMVDEVRKFFGAGHDWVVFRPPDEQPGQGYQVNMPAQPAPTNEQPLGQLVALVCYKTHHKTFLGQLEFVVGASKPQPAGAVAANKDWYDRATTEIVDRFGGEVREQPDVTHQDFPGREVVLERDGGVRVVRVFVIKGRVYYLSVEVRGLTTIDDYAPAFFDSFLVHGAKN